MRGMTKGELYENNKMTTTPKPPEGTCQHIASVSSFLAFKKAISGELQWFHPLHFMLQSPHINLMLSLGCCFYGPMWTLGTALYSWGDVSQKAKKSRSATGRWRHAIDRLHFRSLYITLFSQYPAFSE